MQPAPDLNPMNVGLRKRLASVQSVLNTRRVYIYDAFPRRGNSAQQHLNEITEIKQGKAVQLIFDFEMIESQT